MFNRIRHIGKQANSLKKATCALVALVCLSGCSQTPLTRLNNANPQGSDFTIALAKEYLAFASRENTLYYDQISATQFAKKGLDAAVGQAVPPEALEAHPRLPRESINDLAAARQRLLDVLNLPSPVNNSLELAQAQVNFDCWVEEQEENKQPAAIAFCRNNFLQAIGIAEQKALSGQRSSAALIPTMPYSVYYKIGKSDVPPEAQKVIAQLLALIKKINDYRVVVDGYTDRTGNRATNLKLSETRATKMKSAMVSQGVTAERVRTFGHGDTGATGKAGTPSSKDRRVDITLFAPEDQLVNFSTQP